MKPLVLACLLVTTLFASPIFAADYYMDLAGTGKQDGSNWDNALPYAQVDAVLNTTMQPGDNLYLAGADYGQNVLRIKSSGTAKQRKSLIGVDRGKGLPLFPGVSRSIKGGANIVLAQGASYWTIKTLVLQRRGWGLKTEGGNVGLIVDSVRTFNCVNGLGFYDADDLLVVNCVSERYTRYGFHLAHSCDRVVIRQCYADCTGKGDEPDTDWGYAANPSGFYFHTDVAETPPNTDVLVEDCVSRNNRQLSKNPKTFLQGDGFMSEFNNDRLTFRRCVSYDNQQGAFDLKGTNQVLENCMALRSGNGFKIWKDATLINCIGSSTTGNVVMLIGHKETPIHILTAKNCTFNVGSKAGGAAIWIERGIKGINQATLENCLITRAGSPEDYGKNIIAGGYSGAASNVDFNTGKPLESLRFDKAGDSKNQPNYINPTDSWLPWLNDADAFDNAAYGLTKGYSSTRNTELAKKMPRPAPLPVR